LEDYIDPRINIDRVNLKVKKLTGSERFDQRFSSILDTAENNFNKSLVVSTASIGNGGNSKGRKSVMVNLSTINQIDS
jgi:hypothetical protein